MLFLTRQRYCIIEYDRVLFFLSREHVRARGEIPLKRQYISRPTVKKKKNLESILSFYILIPIIRLLQVGPSYY